MAIPTKIPVPNPPPQIGTRRELVRIPITPKTPACGW